MIYLTHTGGRRLSIGGGVVTLPEVVAPPVSGGSVAWVVSQDANNVLSIAETGDTGASQMAADVVNELGYSITEIQDSAFLADIAGTFAAYDLVIIASFNQYMTAQQQSDFLAAVSGGGKCVIFRDNEFDGSGRDAADAADAMGFDTVLRIQAGQDQFDGASNPTYTTPAGCVLGAGLLIQGEGTSPWVLESPYTGPLTNIQVWVEHWDQTPGNTTGTSYTGQWIAIATADYNQGEFIILNDRQYWINFNNGSYYNKPGYDNKTFVLNTIRYGVTGQSQA